MSKFSITLLLLAISVSPVQLSAYVGLTDSAIKGEVEAVKSLVKRFDPEKQLDIEQVEQALEKVNEKITAIYSGKERTLDQIKLIENIAKSFFGASLCFSSTIALRDATDKFTDISGLRQSWARTFPHKADAHIVAKATVVAVACLGIISAIYAIKSFGSVVDDIENPQKETTAYLKKLLAIREILNNFLNS